jgi:N-acetylmuramoyl-L-alanine amidase
MDGAELVFTFRQAAQASAVVRGDAIELRAWPRPERRVRTIVLDAGHGGKDPGAIGRVRRTEEKGLALDLARRVKTRLESAGYAVLMTRDSDSCVTLAERSQLANRSHADLFVSIHLNCAPNRGACGLETFFLSEAKTDWERAVAARENAELDSSPTGNGGYGPGDLGLILADLAQNEFLHESSELAACIQGATVAGARVKDRGVRQANFYVLRNDFMPAVLVECGFLSNKSEEKLLRQPQHREKLADGIFRGIQSYSGGFARRANGNGKG